QAVGSGAVPHPRRGSGRAIHRSRRPPDDLLELRAGDERTPPRCRGGDASPLTLAIHPGALGDVLLAIPALRVLRREPPGDPLIVAAQPRIGRLLQILDVADRAIDVEGLGLDALFQDAPDGSDGHWPARCADDLRRATRVVAWIGSRDPRFAKRLIALVPGSVVAPSVSPGRCVWEHLVESVGASPCDHVI